MRSGESDVRDGATGAPRRKSIVVSRRSARRRETDGGSVRRFQLGAALSGRLEDPRSLASEANEWRRGQTIVRSQVLGELGLCRRQVAAEALGPGGLARAAGGSCVIVRS